MKIQTDMHKKPYSHLKQYFFLFLTVLIFQSCNYKDSGFFSPLGDTDEPAISIPSLTELEGQYGVNYTYTENNCNDLTGEFNVTAGIRLNTSNTNWLDVLFPDAPSAISGPYDEATGNFMGETDRKDIGQGYTAREMWNMDFYPRMSNDDPVVFGGISRVDIYNPDDTFNCGIDYNIMGEKTMLTVPMLLFPENGSMDIDRDLTFEWQMLNLATGYDFQIIKDGESFENANSFSQSGLSSNMYPVEGLEFSTGYQWRVRASYGNLSSEWSSPWSFTTKEEAPAFFALTVNKDGNGTGFVGSEDGAISCGDSCVVSFKEGREVTLTAEPDEGSVFDGWSGDVPESCNDKSESCTIVMDAVKTVTATFAKKVLKFPDPLVCIEHGTNESKILMLFIFDQIFGGGNITISMRLYFPDESYEDIEIETLEEFLEILAQFDINSYGMYDWEITEAFYTESGEEIPINGTTNGQIEVDSNEQNPGQCEL